MKTKLSFGQLNIAAALIGVISHGIAGFGTGFAGGATAGTVAGLPLHKALWAGVITGGVGAGTSIGNYLSGFLTQRTKGPNGEETPLLPSLTSTDRTDIGIAQAAKAMKNSAPILPPNLLALYDEYQRFENPHLAAISAIMHERDEAAKQEANADYIAKLKQQLAAAESAAAQPVGA